MFLSLFLPLIALLSASSVSPAPFRLARRAVIRGTNQSVPIDLNARYAVRWMDPSQSTFGGTLNLTFTQPSLYAMHWAVRFRLADNATRISQYWGSWQVYELVRSWYQIMPNPDLRLNDAQQVYFSFNGVWNTSHGDWNTTRLAMMALEIQVTDPNNPSSVPVVYQLRDSGEFANTPIPFEIPAAPFGNFIRSASRPASEVAQIQGSLPPVPKVRPTSNFTGTFIVEPILTVFIAIFLVATYLSWRWRQIYRADLAELRANASAGKTQVIQRQQQQQLGLPNAKQDTKSLASQDTAYAGYYMLLDGAWDHQVVREGEEKPVDMYGRPYSVAPVVTDAYYRSDEMPGNGRRRTTVLIPGKEYRMTLMEKGVQMPAEWYPTTHAQKAQMDSPTMPQYEPYQQQPQQQDGSSFYPVAAYTPSSLPAQTPIQAAMPPFVPPRPPPYHPADSSRSADPATTVQSRSLAGARMRKDNVQPARHVAEEVQAVEGAIVCTGKDRETMIERSPAAAAEASTVPTTYSVANPARGSPPTQGTLLMTPPKVQEFLNVNASAFDQIVLSPGWPVSEESGLYSPLPVNQNGETNANSPPRGNGVANKPLPAIGGWNMI